MIMTALVVDDEPAARASLRSYVERAGHVVVEAGSAIEAMSTVASMAVARHRIHVALIDWNLGTTITGIDVARHVRRLHPGAGTLIVSGYTREQMRLYWRDPLEGILAFLSKPIDEASLLRHIQVVADSLEETPTHGGKR